MANRDWHVHIGAHKTATTHLQMQLSERQEELRRKGVFYLPLGEAREALKFRSLPRPLWLQAIRLSGAQRRNSEFASIRFVNACVRHLLAQVDKVAGEATRVVLSEEDFLGTTNEVFGRKYFLGSKRLNLLAALSEYVPLHLYLSTRSLESFLPSAYAQALRAFPASDLNFLDHVHRFADGRPNWAQLVTQIRKKIPKARISIWDYADYAANNMEIQSLITGRELDALAELQRPGRTQSPSVRAIELAEKLAENDVGKRLAAVNAIYASHPAGIESSSSLLIPDHMKDRLQKAYKVEIANIANIQGVDLIRF